MRRGWETGLVAMGLCLILTVTQAEENETQALIRFMQKRLQAGDLIPAVQAVLRAESTTEPGPAQVVERLNTYVMRVYQAGEYRTGLELAKQTLGYATSQLGPEHLTTLTTLNNLAGLYQMQGRYREAEPLFQRALAGFERTLEADHVYILRGLNNLGFLYWAQGRYGEAEPLYQRALAGCERVLGPDHPNTLMTLNNLAGLYQMQGRYGEAEPLFQRALASFERALGPDHPETLTSLNNLAQLYQAQGRYGEAELLSQHALTSREQALGPDHPETLTSLNNLGLLYQAQGRYGEAEPLYQRALTSRERVLGPDHHNTLMTLNNLAWLYQLQGRYREAEPLYQRALASCERVLGRSHPHTLAVQLNYAILLVNREQPRPALQLLKRLEPNLLAFTGSQLSTTLKERVRRQFVVSQSTFQNVVFTLALRQASPEFLAFAADVLVRWKQVQGEEEAFMARLVRTSGDPALQTLGKEIMTLRGDLGRLVNTPEPDPAALRASHEALETKELELARRSRPYEQHLKIRSADVDDVRAHLPQDSVLLELRLYAPVDFNTGTMRALHWLALFLPAVPDGDQEFVLEDLGPVAETQALWEMLRQRGERDTALHLYQRVFGRFEDRLKDVKTLYIAPDGVMHLVALSRLVLPDGRYWVERQTLRQLQTGRDLLASRSEQVPKGLVALGAIDYGTFGEPSSAGTDPQQRTLHRQLTQEIGALRPLAYSGPEVQEIAQYYWDSHGGQAQVWSASDASETRLKTLPTPPRVLHLATHGFYLSHHAATVERPMVLSGVALAGANQGMTGRRSAEGEDGILYALEAQGLNLEGTELVALSACDTGKGTVDYSEGVYGLVRAFRTAGVRRVLMTLWPVDDAMARDFMTRFYAHWLPDQGEPALALQKTRLEFLHHADPTRRDPKVWAPYVLVETR